jgi:K+-sensing histidine kinase KdpD
MNWPTVRPYAESVGLITIVTALGLYTETVLHASNIDAVLVLAVMIIALRSGRGPGLFTAIVAAVVFDFCFVPPYFTFGTSDLPYLVNLVSFGIIAVIVGTLAARARSLTVLQDARARAEARDRAKEEILHKISHELRSPLTAILGWAQLVGQPDLDDARRLKAASGIEHSGRLLARLVDDLSTASRLDAGKLHVERRPTTLDSVVLNAVQLMAAAARNRGVTLDADVDDVPPVLADDQRIEQVVVNVVSNAIKFTPAGRPRHRHAAAQRRVGRRNRRRRHGHRHRGAVSAARVRAVQAG